MFIIQSVSLIPVNDTNEGISSRCNAFGFQQTITAVTPDLVTYARPTRAVKGFYLSRLVGFVESAKYHWFDDRYLHSDQVQGFFHIPVENICSAWQHTTLSPSSTCEQLSIVSPDVGGVERAQAGEESKC